MIRIDRDIVIARPPEVVFDYLADVERFPQWQPAIERAERVTPGPLEPGSRVRLVVRAPTGPTELLGVVDALERPSLLGVRSQGGPVEVTARCTIVPEGAGSRLRLTASIDLKGMLRFVEGAARGMIDRQLPITLADLARRIEEGA